jgi:hypothetical protein
MSDGPTPPSPDDSPGSGAGGNGNPFGREIDRKIDEVLRVKSGGKPDPPPKLKPSPLERFARRQRGEGGSGRRLRTWLLLFTLIVVIIALAVIFGLKDQLSCADDDSTTSGSQPSQTNDSESAQTGGSKASQESSRYDQARAALSMSENTATSQSGSAGPKLVYYFRWVDANGAVQSDIGTVELVDDKRVSGGHAYVYGPERAAIGEGAYQIIKNPLGVELALWIPPPESGDPQLIILHTSDSGSQSLTGWAERDQDGKRTKLEYGVDGKLVTGN